VRILGSVPKTRSAEKGHVLKKRREWIAKINRDFTSLKGANYNTSENKIYG